ncbi:LuxR C-terminal-related transcriptional regulator [Streptomyces sp. NPDC053367]|uniref:LuxR C-terminal-related transcriptional regulator n=1 Tax=Streptomyces sp. NPDC053367 TaxID=3365700 RepID=UPI0037D23A2C
MDVSVRQRQILSLIAEGCSDKEIARRLGVSARTVDSHLQRLYLRYQVHTRAAMVAKWLLSGGSPDPVLAPRAS